MKAMSNIFAIISIAALIWVSAEPKALDLSWAVGEFIGLVVLFGSGRLVVYFDNKSKTIK